MCAGEFKLRQMWDQWGPVIQAGRVTYVRTVQTSFWQIPGMDIGLQINLAQRAKCYFLGIFCAKLEGGGQERLRVLLSHLPVPVALGLHGEAHASERFPEGGDVSVGTPLLGVDEEGVAEERTRHRVATLLQQVAVATCK